MLFDSFVRHLKDARHSALQVGWLELASPHYVIKGMQATLSFILTLEVTPCPQGARILKEKLSWTNNGPSTCAGLWTATCIMKPAMMMHHRAEGFAKRCIDFLLEWPM